MLVVIDRVCCSGGYLHFCGKFLDGFLEYQSRNESFSSTIYIDEKSYTILREFKYLPARHTRFDIHIFPSSFDLYIALFFRFLFFLRDTNILFLNSTSASLFPFHNISSVLHDLKCFNRHRSFKYFARRLVTTLALFNSSRVFCISSFTQEMLMTRLPSLSDKAVLYRHHYRFYPIHIPHVLHLFFLLLRFVC